MNVVSAILVTAAATVGTVRAAKAVRRAIKRRKHALRPDEAQAEQGVIDLVRDDATGIYVEPR